MTSKHITFGREICSNGFKRAEEESGKSTQESILSANAA